MRYNVNNIYIRSSTHTTLRLGGDELMYTCFPGDFHLAARGREALFKVCFYSRVYLRSIFCSYEKART